MPAETVTELAQAAPEQQASESLVNNNPLDVRGNSRYDITAEESPVYQSTRRALGILGVSAAELAVH